MGLQWGRVATDLSQVDQAVADGFDFVQPTGDFAGSLSEQNVTGLGLPFQVCALPLPSDVRVTQRAFNLYVWTEHLSRALRRLARLGCRKLLWSDGRARIVGIAVFIEAAGARQRR